MSQISLAESSSDEASRHAFDAASLRLAPYDEAKDSTPSVEQSFFWKGRYIYEASATPDAATYHLSTRNTHSGNPWQLQICRLLPTEIRRLNAADGSSESQPFIRYDDDLTLYSGEKIHIPLYLGSKPLLVIRGQKKGTVQGSIVMEKAGSRAYKYFHMIPIRRALNQAETERMQALMHKRGYRDSDDWKKKLLLTVQEVSTNGSKELQWIDEDGAVVATESDGKLNMTETAEAKKKDFVVACWACKSFVLDTTA